ncbi:ribonuclease-like [Carettochelys insculpta]|uniref:ribonuclease-like n=1 Tax=Carettochelys insculpta TaxID=44489 RepID=UPI003EB91071
MSQPPGRVKTSPFGGRRCFLWSRLGNTQPSGVSLPPASSSADSWAAGARPGLPASPGETESGRLSAPRTRMGPGPLPLLLPLLLSAGLGTAQRETPFQKFQRQHVDPSPRWEPDPRVYCNRMMAQRRMTVPVCKEINSFVHGALDGIVAVCGRGGTLIHGNYHYSNAPFLVTDCQLTGGSRSPNCIYRGVYGPKRICVACDGGRPVHYAHPRVCAGP